MRTKIITAVASNTQTVITESAYQYDWGLRLEVTGLELPDVTEWQFSNNMSGKAAETTLGDSTGVDIPNDLLISGEHVYAWLFLHSTVNDGYTVYTFDIPVIQRTRPVEEEPTPEQAGLISQAVAALNAAVEQTGLDVIATGEDAAAAAESARQAGLSEESAYASAQAAAGSVGEISDYATAAYNSKVAAQTAQGKAEDAQTAAETAQGKAEGARDLALEAKADAIDAKDTAVSKAGEASQSATDASGYATTASDKATEASTNALKAEGYAVGKQNGSDVSSGTYYHNNAKYYADNASGSATTATTKAGEASTSALQAEGYAVGKQNGTDVASGSPYYHNNSKYYAAQAQAVAESIPADYTTLSNDVSELKSDLNELAVKNKITPTWHQGWIRNTGEIGSAQNYCYCDYIESNGLGFTITGAGADGYKVKVAKYNSSKTFTGILIAETADMPVSFSVDKGDFIRIQYGKGDSATTPSSITDDVFVLTYNAFTDTSLTLSGKAADSDAVGKRASGIDDKIGLIAEGAYETVKGVFELGSILNGVNSTTTTRIRHKSAVSYDRDITIFVKDGFKYYVAFYDASNTYLHTREFVTKDLPITIKSGLRFRMVICKTTEDTVTDIDTYVNAVVIGTQLFSNPFVYKNSLVRQIAHQGYSGDPGYSTGRNLVSSYIYAGIVGFTHGECDIKFTSDNVPVCAHDASFTDATSGATVVIADHTYTELIAYDYYGDTIASFDDVVKTCKMYGMGLYIDHLDASWSSTQWNALFNVIKKYGMAKHIVWLLPAITNLLTDPIKSFDADASFSYVLTSVPQSFSAAVSAMAELKTDSNIVSIDVPSTAFPASEIEAYAELMTASVQLEVWVVDNISSYMAYLPYVNGITSNKICSNIARYA